MKIISKYRDYYDYLTGIYGIDEKLVLDRREGVNIEFPPNYLRFYIAGYIIEGLYINKQFYYGEKLNQFKYNGKAYPSRHWKRDYSKSIYVKYKGNIKSSDWIYLEPVKDKDEINLRFDCPILINKYSSNNERHIEKFPILKNFNLASFIPAETIYKWLSEWLGNQISSKEQSPELSNNNKIESKGFDLKTSFRPNINN